MITMSVEDQLYLAVAYRATNIAALARELGISRQTLHRKIKLNTLKKEELCKIAKVLGGQYITYFAFPGGVKIGIVPKRRKSSPAPG